MNQFLKNHQLNKAEIGVTDESISDWISGSQDTFSSIYYYYYCGLLQTHKWIWFLVKIVILTIHLHCLMSISSHSACLSSMLSPHLRISPLMYSHSCCPDTFIFFPLWPSTLHPHPYYHCLENFLSTVGVGLKRGKDNNKNCCIDTFIFFPLWPSTLHPHPYYHCLENFLSTVGVGLKRGKDNNKNFTHPKTHFVRYT